MSNVTAINRARIVVLAQAAIQAIESLLREAGEMPASETVRAIEQNPNPRRAGAREPGGKPAGPQCPDCGGVMVSRQSSRGPFYGCKQYPHCTGTRPGQGERNANSEHAPGNSESESWDGAR